MKNHFNAQKYIFGILFLKLNFSLLNGTYTGVLSEVVNGHADVSFNSRFLDDPMSDKAYRYSNTNGLDYICFVVPRAGPLSIMQILWMTFTFEVWLCVAFIYTMIAKFFQFFNKIEFFGGRKISDPLMTSLQVQIYSKFKIVF